jgi:hypothetical protein
MINLSLIIISSLSVHETVQSSEAGTDYGITCLQAAMSEGDTSCCVWEFILRDRHLMHSLMMDFAVTSNEVSPPLK